MSAIESLYGYNFAFFDILGFSEKISRPGGLEEIKDVYVQLTEIINGHNERYNNLKSSNMPMGVYGTIDGAFTMYWLNVPLVFAKLLNKVPDGLKL